MFRRTESTRERTLLRIIEQQQQQIRDLTDRLMYVQGQPWTLPPLPENVTVPPEYVPPAWTPSPEQAAIY